MADAQHGARGRNRQEARTEIRTVAARAALSDLVAVLETATRAAT